MSINETLDWRELCRAAAREQDPARLLHLLHEINRALIGHRTECAESHLVSVPDSNPK
jgi:hypothetical protein